MSQFLLDTQIFIWFAEGDSRLPKNIKMKLLESEEEIFFSTVSAWEMAIKVSVKKLKFRGSVSDLIRRHCGSDFTLLPIGLEDVLAVESLPLIHRDPFDRLLVAQAQRKDLEIISTDKVFDAYGVKRLG
jgi:PIN domain nuclease of toxin-antitoxin system